MGKKYSFKGVPGDAKLVIKRKDGKNFCMWVFMGMAIFLISMGTAAQIEKNRSALLTAAATAVTLVNSTNLTATPTSAPTSSPTAPTHRPTSSPTKTGDTLMPTSAPTSAPTLATPVEEEGKDSGLSTSVILICCGVGVFLVALLFGGMIGGWRHDVLTIRRDFDEQWLKNQLEKLSIDELIGRAKENGAEEETLDRLSELSKKDRGQAKKETIQLLVEQEIPWVVSISQVAWGRCVLNEHIYMLAKDVKADTGSKSGGLKKGKRTTAYAVTLPLDMSAGSRTGKKQPELRVWAGNAQKAAEVERKINEFIYPHKNRDDPFFSEPWKPTVKGSDGCHHSLPMDLNRGGSPGLWGRNFDEEDPEEDHRMWTDLDQQVQEEWKEQAQTRIQSHLNESRSRQPGPVLTGRGSFSNMAQTSSVAIMMQKREQRVHAESARIKLEMEQMERIHAELSKDQESGVYDHATNNAAKEEAENTLSALSQAIWESKSKLKEIEHTQRKQVVGMPSHFAPAPQPMHNFVEEEEEEDDQPPPPPARNTAGTPRKLSEKQKRAAALQQRNETVESKTVSNSSLIHNSRSVVSRLKAAPGSSSNPRPTRRREISVPDADTADDAASGEAPAAQEQPPATTNEQGNSRSVLRRLKSGGGTPTRKRPTKGETPARPPPTRDGSVDDAASKPKPSSRSVIGRISQSNARANEPIKDTAAAVSSQEDVAIEIDLEGAKSRSARTMSMMMSAMAHGADVTAISNASTPPRVGD